MRLNPAITGLLLLSLLLQSCHQPTAKSATDKQDKSTQTVNDTTAIRSLLISVYQWHDKQPTDYRVIDNGHNKLGIDSLRMDTALTQLKKINFFTDGFLNNYLALGRLADHKIRQDTSKYPAGLIEFPFEDYDIWWGGNGVSPDWHDIKISSLRINKDDASLRWNCDSAGIHDFYSVRFKRVNNDWKLDYLQDFDLKNY